LLMHEGSRGPVGVLGAGGAYGPSIHAPTVGIAAHRGSAGSVGGG
jgi:hypothetical protein